MRNVSPAIEVILNSARLCIHAFIPKHLLGSPTNTRDETKLARRNFKMHLKIKLPRDPASILDP